MFPSFKGRAPCLLAPAPAPSPLHLRLRGDELASGNGAGLGNASDDNGLNRMHMRYLLACQFPENTRGPVPMLVGTGPHIWGRPLVVYVADCILLNYTRLVSSVSTCMIRPSFIWSVICPVFLAFIKSAAISESTDSHGLATTLGWLGANGGWGFGGLSATKTSLPQGPE